MKFSTRHCRSSRKTACSMIGLSLLAFSSAHATTFTWLPTDITGAWDTTTSNWDDGVSNPTTWVNGATSDASFPSFAATTTITLAEAVTAESITTNGGSDILFKGTQTMDVATITTQSGGNFGSVFLYNELTGDHGLTFNGGSLLTGESGRLNFKAAATYTGDTNLTGTAYLTFAAGTNNSLPTTTTVNMGTGLSTLRFTSNNQTQEIMGLSGSNASAYVRGNGVTGNILTINTKSGVTTAYEGRITDNISLVISGSGTQRFASPNSSTTGTITIQSGTLNTASLANGGLNSPIGASSSDATNLVFDGGTLKYTGGSAAVTDRAFTINDGKTATIEAAKDLTFAGATGPATTGGLTKTGVGTLIFTGVNTYTGDTTVSAGVLAVNGSTIADSGKLIISGGKVNLTGAETVKSLFFGGIKQIPGTYSADGASGTISSTNFTGTGTLIVLPDMGDPYTTWIDSPAFNTPPLSATDKLPGADPDGDGASNIIEFATNGNPVDGSNNGLIASVIQDSSAPAGQELTLVVAVLDGAAFGGGATATVGEVTYTVEGSLDLTFPGSAVSSTGPADTAPGGSGLPSLAGTGWEYQTFKLDASEGLGGKGFLRLKVTQP